MGCKCMRPMGRRVHCYRLRKYPLRKLPLRKCPLRHYTVLKYLLRSIGAPQAQNRWRFYDESQVLPWYGSDERRLSLGQGGRVASHSNSVNKIVALWMNIFKMRGIRNQGCRSPLLAAWEQFKSFGCLVWRMLATCSAMQLRAGEPKLASIFLTTQCLSDTHADTGLGQVDLVDRKTSHFCIP